MAEVGNLHAKLGGSHGLQHGLRGSHGLHRWAGPLISNRKIVR